MESTFIVRKEDGEEVEVADNPANREKARSKNLDVYESLTSPKGEDTLVPAHLAAAAIKKGYQFSDTYQKPFERTKKNPLESGAMALTEGALLGTDDEIIGRGRQLLHGEAYKKARDTYRQDKKWAKEDNPGTYDGFGIAGSVGTAAITPALGLARGAGLAGRALSAGVEGAGYGALSAYGGSESDDLGEQLKDTASGAALGGAMGAGITGAIGGAAKGISAIPPARNLVKKAYQHIGEVPDHLAEKIMDDPDIVNRARNHQGTATLADDIAEAANRLRGEQAQASEAAWASLVARDRQGARIPGTLYVDSAIDIAKSNNIYGPQKAQRMAKKKLVEAVNDVKQVRNYSDMKRAIERIDQNINWESPGDELSNKVLQQYRTALDSKLKEIPAYRSAMKPVAEKTKAIQELQNKFGLKKGSTTVNGNVEPSFYPTDRTITQAETQASQSLMEKSKGTYTRKMLEQQAPEVLEQIESAGMKKFMDRDIGRGSRSTMVGTAAGWILQALGIPVGPVGGAMIGYGRDKMGREFAAQGLANLGRRSMSTGAQVSPQLGGLLEKAFKRGGNAAVIAYHGVLMQRVPEYREAFQEEYGNEE